MAAAATAARATEQTFSYAMAIMIMACIINLELWAELAALEYISVVACEDVMSGVMAKNSGTVMEEMPSVVAIGIGERRRGIRSATTDREDQRSQYQRFS
jgi:hypothetical protein